jgi:hypothetical protein
MFFDQVGNLWAVGPEGVFVLKPGGTLLHFTAKDGLPSNDLLSVGQDGSNAIWVGSNGSGAARFDGTSWQAFSTADGLAGNTVFDITRYTDATGALMGTDHGVSWYNNITEKWTNYSSPPYLPDDVVRSLVVLHKDGSIWLATPQGVRLLETSQVYTTADGLVSNDVSGIAFAPDCSIWIATSAGVSSYNDGAWTSYTVADGLVDNFVSSIAVSVFDVAWFGTPSGLSRFDGKNWTTYTAKDGLASDDVLSVIVALDDTLWIGTSAGLSHYSPSLASQAGQTAQSTSQVLGSDAEFPFIYIKGGDLWALSAGVVKQLTKYGNISGYFLSTDRRKLAVYRRGENNETGLWVMNPDGSDLRLLVSQADLDTLGEFSETEQSRQTNSRVSFRGTAWVPGTYTIAYGTYRPIKYDGTIFHDDLNLVDVLTGEKTTLLPPGSGGSFTYSPDGSQVAIIGLNQISIMNADGTNRHDNVLEYSTIQDVDNYYYPRPNWSADGRYLLLALPPQRMMSDSRETTTLWKIPADGSPAIRLGSFDALAFLFGYTTFSPDLTHLAYLDEADPFYANFTIHIANYDGTDDRVLFTGRNYFVNWSPDGLHFAYYLSSDDTEVWYISDLNGVSARLAITPTFLRWVDNSTFVQYDSLPCGGYELRLTSISGESQVIDRYW